MRLDPRQQQLGYIAAAIAAVAFPIVGVIAGTAPAVVVPIAFGLALVMAFFVRQGRAAPAAVAAIGLSFVPQNEFRLMGSPYVLYGFWVMYTASRAKREERAVAAALAKAEKQAAKRAAPRTEGGRPAASKRYTPPSAKRPRR